MMVCRAGHEVGSCQAMRPVAALAVIIALAPAARAQDPNDVLRVAPQAGDDGALEVARALRAQDPDVRQGGALAWWVLKELLRGPIQPGPDGGVPGAAEALEGFSARADRTALPEFASARAAQGRSIREHLLNAVYLNASRMGYYSKRAGFLRGFRSRLLSRYMVVGEAVAIAGIALGKFDEKAREASARSGRDILVGDLMPLLPLPKETPPRFRGVADAAQRKNVHRLVDDLTRDTKRALDAGDLDRVALLCAQATLGVIARENAWKVHFHMTRHTIGSVGLAALRGAEHARAGAGTRGLHVDYLRGLVRTTYSYGLNVDRLAQPLQARGLGIVVNEFTDQAFRDAWAAQQRATGAAGALSRTTR